MQTNQSLLFIVYKHPFVGRLQYSVERTHSVTSTSAAAAANATAATPLDTPRATPLASGCARRPTPHPLSDSQCPVGHAAGLLNDEPVRIYVPLLMRPWLMQGSHSTASFHLGTTLTLRMLERFTGGLV